VAQDPATGELVDGDIAQQADQILRNIAATLAAIGEDNAVRMVTTPRLGHERGRGAHEFTSRFRRGLRQESIPAHSLPTTGRHTLARKDTRRHSTTRRTEIRA
jgi:hypothetical protein